MQKSNSTIFGINYEYFINDCMASSSIGKNNEWEPHITKLIKLINTHYKTKSIIDVGANFGYHTLIFSQQCEWVYAFEPQSQNFELLQNNVKNNEIHNTTIYNLACGNENCSVQMPLFNDSKIINMGDVTPNMDCMNCTTTKSVVLDDFSFSNIDLIKIDVQGWEKKVLIGANHLLKINKPILIVEFEKFQLIKTNTTCKELFDYIRELDYYIFYLEYEYPSDHVCVHKDNLHVFREKFKNYIYPHTENNNINDNFINGICEKIVLN
uniref:Methyltransferase FkbM domain-containing protein n=1 Tax=viral metagenome TaxID=1070528 RepID=A0A6C0D0K1_9ZZZZ